MNLTIKGLAPVEKILPTTMLLFGLDGELLEYCQYDDEKWRGPCPRCVSNSKDKGTSHADAVGGAVTIAFLGRLVQTSAPEQSTLERTRARSSELGRWMLVVPETMMHVGCFTGSVIANHFKQSVR